MSSTFETLPRELRDQIYNEVLPSGKLILPVRPAPDTTPIPTFTSPAILTVNRSIYAETVVRLYATNKVLLFRPTHSGDGDALKAAGKFWQRLGPSIQHVRLDLTEDAVIQHYCMASDGYMGPRSLDKVDRLWRWERMALLHASDNKLQTLTLDLNACTQNMSLADYGEYRTAAVISMVKSLQRDIAPWRVTLHWHFRWWFKGGGGETMERRSDVGEARYGEVVKHLVSRGLSDSTEGGAVLRLCQDMWSLTVL